MIEIGKLEFTSNDEELNRGFEWAKAQALAYAHDDGDPIGKWYDAALPGREGFCIRDVCHQADGAHALGLESYTKNMLLRFAQSISESKDFCCFWEMTRHYTPYFEDYYSDDNFWYNLPANFDLLAACLRMYKLTGDRDYIESEDFLHFYRLTVTKYVEKWDTDGDGIPEGTGTRRGIPSYEEGEGRDSAQMLDLLAAEAAAMNAYAEICEIRDESGEKYRAWADSILAEIDRRWDEETQRYYFFKLRDGSFVHSRNEASECLLYFGAAADDRKRAITLEKLHGMGIRGLSVEVGSHLAEIFYGNGLPDYGEHWLSHFTAPELERREYPELSYATVGAYVFGMMGVKYDLESRTITAEPKLPAGMTSATLTGLPVYGRLADIEVKDGVVSISYRDE